jgi:hypothetical protein
VTLDKAVVFAIHLGVVKQQADDGIHSIPTNRRYIKRIGFLAKPSLLSI